MDRGLFACRQNKISLRLSADSGTASGAVPVKSA
jgi:hypothetical protein